MPHAHPFDPVASSHRIRNAIEGIACNSINALHSRRSKNLYKELRDSLCHNWTPLGSKFVEWMQQRMISAYLIHRVVKGRSVPQIRKCAMSVPK